jgi:uncharacterized membrane protein YhfC
MRGIYVAALLASGIGAAVVGAVIYRGDHKRFQLFWLTLLALPLSPVVNVLVKAPFVRLISAACDRPSLVGAPFWFLTVVLLTAPVSEELVKLLPFVSKRLRAWMVDRRRAVFGGLAVGLGFGLGEIGFLAAAVASNDPITAALPVHLLGGFVVERCISVFAHGVFSAIALTGLVLGGRPFLFYIGGAVAAHALSNVASLLFQMGIISDQAAANVLYATFVLLGLLLVYLLKKARASIQPGDGPVR